MQKKLSPEEKLALKQELEFEIKELEQKTFDLIIEKCISLK